MNNSEKFKQVFGIYATELWAMTEAEYFKWLNHNYTGSERSKSMNDYIKREDAIKSIMAHDPAIELGESGSRVWAEYLLENATSADAVEVIRCKDCKYYVPISERIGECKDTRMNSPYMHYCGYAERKTNDE